MEGRVVLKEYIVDLQGYIQQGIFGTVLHGNDKKARSSVTIKSIQCEKKSSNIRTELQELSTKIQHPHIIELLNVYEKDNILWIVHARKSDTNLLKYLAADTKLNSFDKVLIMHQLVSAINFLHSCNPQVLHTDIQLQNIYVQRGDGISTFISGCCETSILRSHGLPVNGFLSDFVAPEIIAERKHTAMSDVFSVGAVMLVLFSDDCEACPRSEYARGKGTHISLGSEMHYRNSMGLAEVPILTMKKDDKSMVKFCKQLILEMTKFKPSSRMPLKKIEPLFEQVTERTILTGKGKICSKPQAEEAKPLVDTLASSRESVTRPLESIKLGQTNGLEGSAHDNLNTLDCAHDSEIEDTDSDGDGNESGVSDNSDSDTTSLHPLAALLALVGIMESEEAHEPVTIGDYAIFAPTQRQKLNVKSQCGDDVDKYLGAAGQLIEKNDDDHFRVQFADGQILNIEDSLLKKIDDCPWKFRKGDLVKVAADKRFVEEESDGHGGWTEKMILVIGEKGVVQDVDTDGDISVKGLNGLSWWMNPSVLTTMTDSKDEIRGGCFVTITIDFLRLRDTQNKYNIWNESMQKTIGSMGQVKQIYSDGFYDVETGIGINKYHKSVISFVATDDEVAKCLFLRQQYERKELSNGLKSIACNIS